MCETGVEILDEVLLNCSNCKTNMCNDKNFVPKVIYQKIGSTKLLTDFRGANWHQIIYNGTIVPPVSSGLNEKAEDTNSKKSLKETHKEGDTVSSTFTYKTLSIFLFSFCLGIHNHYHHYCCCICSCITHLSGLSPRLCVLCVQT